MQICKVLFALTFAMCIPCNATLEEQLITEQEIVLEKSGCLKGWYDDFADAMRAAKEQNCPLLVAFLGPNWCPFSDKLEEEILADPFFMQELGKKLVFLKVDIPEDFELQETHPAAILKEKYEISECPAVLILEPEGKEIAKLQYLPLDGQDFAALVHESLSDYCTLAKCMKKQELKTLSSGQLQDLYSRSGKLADETFKKALLKQGLKTDNSPFFLMEKYGERLAQGKISGWKSHHIRKKIASLDPENLKGVHRQMAVMDFKALSTSLMETDKVIKPLVDYLKKFGEKDIENSWRIEMMISKYLFSKNQISESLVHAKNSLRLAPEEKKKEIKQSIHYLESQNEKSLGEHT